jgi:trimeric autotransporter adhesin
MDPSQFDGSFSAIRAACWLAAAVRSIAVPARLGLVAWRLMAEWTRFGQLSIARKACCGVRAWTVTLVVPVGVLFLSGCQSSSRQLVGPSGTKCDVSIPGNLPSIGADGGSGSLTISAARECAWSVTTGASWISITSERTGQGPGVVNYTASVNPTPVARRGAFTVGDQQVELLQDAAPCHFTFTPSVLTVDAEGGETAVSVTAIAGCTWMGVSETSWIAITGPAEGNGAGAVRLRVEPNFGDERTGRVRLAGQAYTVSQRQVSAPECSAMLAPPAENVPAVGTSLTVSVTIPPGCAWTAVSQAPWIGVTRGVDGMGAGAVDLSIRANSGPERAGIVRIAGLTYTVTQSAATSPQPCSFLLGSTTQSVAAGGGSVTVTVSTAVGCGWMATSQVSWIAVESSAQGSGYGSVTLTVGPNSGAERSGVVTVAGQTFTVNQATGTSTPPCSYALGSTTQSVPAGGGAVVVSVLASTGCAWTATSHVGWITVTNGAQGSGSDAVAVSVAANPGVERSGTISIAGQTYTVTQASGAPQPCAYHLSSNDAALSAPGGAITVSVTTTAGCAWTAARHVPWVVVVAGATGNSSGTVSLNVAANTGAQRVGTVAVAGQTFTVTQGQASTACAYSISPKEQSVSSLGGTFSVTVTTQSGCVWSATSNVPWIEIDGGRSESGSGTLTYKVGIGTVIFSREGTLTVAGQTLTVRQAGLLITGGQ